MKRLFIGIFILSSIIASLLINQYQKATISQQLFETTDKYLRAFRTVYDHKKELSKILFTWLVKIKKIDENLYQALQDSEQKDITRKKLWENLEQHYTQLYSMGIRQISFFLPNNENFLRLHKPTIFGDDVTNIRSSITYVNKHHITLDTFEKGENSYSFRFVYPIFYHKTYVGCMEISFGAASFTSSLMKEYYILSNFFVKKNPSKTKFSDTSHSIYIPSTQKGFFFNKEVLTTMQEVTRQDLKNLVLPEKTRQKIREIALSGNIRSVYDAQLKTIFTIIPIVHKLTNENMAFLSIRSKSDTIITSQGYILTISILVISIIALALFLLYTLLLKKISLQKEVAHKTQTLNDINMNLEQRVEEKTKELSKNYEKLSKLSSKVEEERHKYKKILELASDNIFILRLDGSLYECSKKTISTLGYTKEEIFKLNVFDWNPALTKEKYEQYMQELKYGMLCMDTIHKCKDGSTYAVQINANLLKIGEEQYIYASSRDISKEKKLEQQLLHERDFAFSILNNSTMVILTDGNELHFANRALLDFFNCEDIDTFKQTYKCVCYHFIHSNKYFHLGKIHNKKEWIFELEKLSEEQRLVSLISQQTYEPKAFHLSISKHNDELYLINFTDISEQIVKQWDLENQVIHDKLTNAYNREYFDKNIETIIKTNSSKNKKTAIAILDIDHFKRINDTYGHDIGDEVLKHLVKTIQKNSRESDTLIRWGGEEFILILTIDNVELLYKVLNHCKELIANTTFKKITHITCSFGATLYQDEEIIEATLKRADIGLYQAKRNGRNQVIIL